MERKKEKEEENQKKKKKHKKTEVTFKKAICNIFNEIEQNI